MDSWQRINETLPDTEKFYSKLTIEDYKYVKNICKDFEWKNLDDYCNLYVQSDALSPVDIFDNFHKKCI